jgi:hypothetical protein
MPRLRRFGKTGETAQNDAKPFHPFNRTHFDWFAVGHKFAVESRFLLTLVLIL